MDDVNLLTEACGQKLVYENQLKFCDERRTIANANVIDRRHTTKFYQINDTGWRPQVNVILRLAQEKRSPRLNEIHGLLRVGVDSAEDLPLDEKPGMHTRRTVQWMRLPNLGKHRATRSLTSQGSIARGGGGGNPREELPRPSTAMRSIQRSTCAPSEPIYHANE